MQYFIKDLSPYEYTKLRYWANMKNFLAVLVATVSIDIATQLPSQAGEAKKGYSG